MEINKAEVTVAPHDGVCLTPAPEFPITEVIRQIEKLNGHITNFWSKSHGWAPVAAAGLLDKSRLDWQVSLSGSLRL